MSKDSLSAVNANIRINWTGRVDLTAVRRGLAARMDGGQTLVGSFLEPPSATFLIPAIGDHAAGAKCRYAKTHAQILAQGRKISGRKKSWQDLSSILPIAPS